MHEESRIKSFAAMREGGDTSRQAAARAAKARQEVAAGAVERKGLETQAIEDLAERQATEALEQKESGIEAEKIRTTALKEFEDHINHNLQLNTQSKIDDNEEQIANAIIRGLEEFLPFGTATDEFGELIVPPEDAFAGVRAYWTKAAEEIRKGAWGGWDVDKTTEFMVTGKETADTPVPKGGGIVAPAVATYIEKIPFAEEFFQCYRQNKNIKEIKLWEELSYHHGLHLVQEEEKKNILGLNVNQILQLEI